MYVGSNRSADYRRGGCSVFTPRSSSPPQWVECRCYAKFAEVIEVSPKNSTTLSRLQMRMKHWEVF
jgi:hypothetical protein